MKTRIILGAVGVVTVGAVLGFMFWPEKKPVKTVYPDFKSLLQQPPISFSDDVDWLANEAGSLASLKGKVVWLEFNYTENYAYRTRAKMLVKWHDTFSPEGLQIIHVVNGALDADLNASEADIRSVIRRTQPRYAMLLDPVGATSKKYEIRRYPTSYLISREGIVVWEGIRNYTLAESRIREELDK